MSLFNELRWRGLSKQITDPELEKHLSTGSRTLYCGFDPTSDSLHVGSLLPLLTLSRFQKAGHRVIAVVGGATGMVGDPSGKSQERNLLDSDSLKRNVEGIRKVISRFLDLKGSNPAQVVNNADWTQGVSYLDFLRDIGKHFTINHMMAKESVRARLEDREHGISYTEFSYMLLQAYDFYILNLKNKCTLQIGGSDQWGNITAGCELIRRMAAHSGFPAPEVFGLTHPLITKSDGSKFGKTEKGTVWLDSTKTSPYQFYQFLLQVDDADIVLFLKYLSFYSEDQILALESSLKTQPEKRDAQRALAESLTRLVHGESELGRAQSASNALFSESLSELDAELLHELFGGAPTLDKPRSLLEGEGISLIDLVAESGLSGSKGAARKDIAAGGVYLNNRRESDINKRISTRDLIGNGILVLRKGKKNYFVIRFN